MIEIMKNRFEKYKQLNDIHQFDLLLGIAADFTIEYKEKSLTMDELELGIDIIRELTTLNYLGSLPQYEHSYDLHKLIRHSQIKVFKTCIPESHATLRGLTELLLGMKENSVELN